MRFYPSGKPLPGAPIMLGADHPGSGNLPAGAARSGGYRSAGGSYPPRASSQDIDVVIGVRGPIAPPEMCNGLMVPIVVFDQIYSFGRDALIKAIPKPEKMTDKQFGPAAEELFDRMMQMTDNAGATDEHRALNYLAMRYPAIYAKAAEKFGR